MAIGKVKTKYWKANSNWADSINNKNLYKQKKIILLDKDPHYSKQLKIIGKQESIEVINCYSLNEFTKILSENENQVLDVVVDSFFLTDMIKKSLFIKYYFSSFIIIGNKPTSMSIIKKIPIKKISFIDKNKGVAALLKNYISKQSVSIRKNNHNYR